MKVLFIPFILGCLITLLTLSCSKAKDDVEAPLVTIFSPDENSRFSETDSILISVVLEDEDMHNYFIAVANEENSCCKVLDYRGHSHDKMISFSQKLAPQVKGNYTLQIRATDHNGNRTEFSRLFFVD